MTGILVINPLATDDYILVINPLTTDD